MWPDRVSNPGPLIYESGVLPTVLRGPALNETSLSAWYGMISKVSLVKKSTGSIEVHYKYQKIIQTLHKTLTGIRASYLFGLQ